MKLLRLIHAVFLAAACFSVYSNGYDHAYNLDSLHTIAENPSVRSLENIPSFFTDPGTFSTLRSNVDYRPVLQVTYALNYSFAERYSNGGYKMWSWHFVQILLHLCCVLGLYTLCERVFRRSYKDAAEWTVASTAFIAALVFAFHPTASGVVNYLSARSSLLTAAFLFPAIVLYMPRPSGVDRAWRLWTSAGLYGLALFTKVEAVACLAVFFLSDVWDTRVRAPDGTFFHHILRSLNVRTLVRLAPFLALTLVYFLIRRNLMAEFEFEEARKIEGVSWLDYLRTQLIAWWYYVAHWFAPFDLVADYQRFPVSRSFEPKVLVAGAGILAAAWCCIAQWRARPYLAFLAASALALLSPHSSIKPLAEMVNEHRPYMPVAVLSLAWMIPAGLWFMGRSTAGKVVPAIALGLGLLAFQRMTYERNRVFHTSESYWRDVVEKAPSSRSHLNYARVFMARTDFSRALEHLRKSVQLAPFWHVTHVNLAVTYDALGQDALALEHFNRAVDYDKFTGTALSFRAEYLLKKGRYREAANDYVAAIPRSLEHYRNHKGAATAFAGLGDADGCLEHTLRCLDYEPGRTHREIRDFVGPFFVDPARQRAGIDYFEKLKARLPDTWWVYENIAILARLLKLDELAEENAARSKELQASR